MQFKLNKRKRYLNLSKRNHNFHTASRALNAWKRREYGENIYYAFCMLDEAIYVTNNNGDIIPKE